MAAKVVAQIQALAEPQLEAGEQFLGGVRVNQKGMTTGAALGGLVGAAVAHRAAKGQREAQRAAGLPALTQMAFGLTDRRVLIFSRSAMSGKPKAFVAALALDDVVGIDFEPAMLLPKLSISFHDGNVARFEAVRIDEPEAFANALRDALAKRAA
jgi:hypothetical protein